VKYVHRTCLDTWRATNPNGRAFTHCSICGFEYVVEVVDDAREDSWRKRRFCLFVARDTFLCFLITQLLIVGFGALVKVCDVNGKVLNLFPALISEHSKTTYYICGLLIFLAVLGLVGTIAWCCGYYNSPYGHRRCGGANCWYCWWPQGIAETGEACLVFGLIILVVFVFIGIFVGIFLGSILIQRIMQKHIRILWLREETKKYVVVNFDGQNVPVRAQPAQPQPVSSNASNAEPEQVAPDSHQLPIRSEEDRPLLSRSQNNYPEGLFTV